MVRPALNVYHVYKYNYDIKGWYDTTQASTLRQRLEQWYAYGGVINVINSQEIGMKYDCIALDDAPLLFNPMQLDELVEITDLGIVQIAEIHM